MNVTEVERLLDRIELAPWYRELDWEVERLPLITDYPIARFRITYMEPDTETGAEERQLAAWWYVEPSMDEEALIKRAWLALTVSDEHRRREGFRVDQALIFNPHTRIISRIPRNESVTRIKTWDMRPTLQNDVYGDVEEEAVGTPN